MSEAKVKAEAIFIVIKKILKWLGISLLSIAIVLFLIFKYEEYKRNQEKLIEEKVSVNVFHPKEGPCSKDFPYKYVIVNDSGRTVEKITFTVGIKRTGFSSDLNRYTSIIEDKIISNNEGYERCFRALVEGSFTEYLKESDVNIEIKYKDVTFKKVK